MVTVRRLGILLLLFNALGSVSWAQSSDDAKRCAETSNPDLAIHHCTAAIQSGRLSEADLETAFNNRGKAYMRKGDYDRAIQDYDQAIRLKPDYALAFNNRGIAYGRKGDYDRAIQDHDEAIRLKPDDAGVFYNRGITYNDKGDHDRAIQDYDQAIRLKPDYADAFNNRGNAYRRKGDYDRAIQDYDQAIRLEPKSATRLRARGITRFCLMRFAAAQEDFVLALQLDPTDPYSVIWLYLARARNGQDARTDLEKKAAGLKLTDWPGRIIELYLGRASKAVLSAAKDSNPKKDENKRCEAYFFLGEYALLQGNAVDAALLFREAIATGATNNLAYSGAQAELKHLTPE